MNERIRELAEQAKKYARDYVADCKHHSYYLDHNEYDIRFAEKFAELIVKECMCIADDMKALDVAAELERYFGVEE